MCYVLSRTDRRAGAKSRSRANKPAESGNPQNGKQAEGQAISQQVLTRTGKGILSGRREKLETCQVHRSIRNRESKAKLAAF